jgi:phosphoribosyl 1,2-cyclic phosphate phosphodiesterase
VAELIRGVPHLILDALRVKPHPTHMNVEEALAVEARAQAGQTWFTHLCHDLSHVQMEAMLPAGVNAAYDGLRLSL